MDQVFLQVAMRLITSLRSTWRLKKLSGKRRRYNKKAQPKSFLSRVWRWIDESVEDSLPDKISMFFSHPAACLEEWPLSENALAVLERHPRVNDDTIIVAKIRKMVKSLDKQFRLAHSFKLNNKWYSFDIAHLVTYYEDVVLSLVGRERMKEWWQNLGETKQTNLTSRTGCAVCFWYSLDGDNRLPYAIEMGARSMEIAQFDEVFVLAYQEFINMPNWIKMVDANLVNFPDVAHPIINRIFSWAREKT